MPENRVPKWLATTCLVAAGAALAISLYLTIEHFASPSGAGLACPATGTINCVKVTTSPQSRFLGIPVALLGLAFYVGVFALNLPAMWRSSSSAVRWARLAAVSVGMAFVLWLIYAELYIIRLICLWCTAVHILTFVLFALTLYATMGLAERDDDEYEEDEEEEEAD